MLLIFVWAFMHSMLLIKWQSTFESPNVHCKFHIIIIISYNYNMAQTSGRVWHHDSICDAAVRNKCQTSSEIGQGCSAEIIWKVQKHSCQCGRFNAVCTSEVMNKAGTHKSIICIPALFCSSLVKKEPTWLCPLIQRGKINFFKYSLTKYILIANAECRWKYLHVYIRITQIY